MLFATLLIAAVCAQDNEKTVNTSPKSNAFTLKEEKDRDIFSNVDKIELLILRNFNETSQSEFLAPLSNPNDVCYPNCSEQGPQPKLFGGNGENRKQYQKQKENNQKENNNNQKENNNNQKEDNQKENNNNQKEDNQKENNNNQKENNNNQKEDNQKENNNNQKENKKGQENNKRRNLAHDLAQETVSRTDQARGKYKTAAIDLKAVDNDMLGISATAKTYTTAKEMAEILKNLFNPAEFQWPKNNIDSTENEKKFYDSLNDTFEGKLKSPRHDYNLRIVEKEDHCTKQAEHFPETFAANFTKDKWAKYNALDEKVLTPFKQDAKFLPYFTTFSETIKYDTFWDDITTDDYLEEATVKRLAVAGCKFKKIREIFKENASDFTGHGNSVASFGLSAILALAVFGL